MYHGSIEDFEAVDSGTTTWANLEADRAAEEEYNDFLRQCEEDD